MSQPFFVDCFRRNVDVKYSTISTVFIMFIDISSVPIRIHSILIVSMMIFMLPKPRLHMSMKIEYVNCCERFEKFVLHKWRNKVIIFLKCTYDVHKRIFFLQTLFFAAVLRYSVYQKYSNSFVVLNEIHQIVSFSQVIFKQ